MNDTSRPRYRWPWYVLAAVVLAIVLAALWMSVAVRRVRQFRDPNSVPFPSNSTNTLPSSGGG